MKVDEKHMLSSAVQFFLAGERLTQSIKFADYPEHILIPSNIIMYSLSVEIILKFFAYKINQNVIHGHIISELYNSLPLQDQELIASTPPIGPTNAGDLSDDLRSIDGKNSAGRKKSAFELWRYGYENVEINPISINILRDFFISAHNASRVRFPNLSSSYEDAWGGLKFDDRWNAWPSVWFEAVGYEEGMQAQDDKRIFHEILREKKE
ncbi:hypothetical protein [Bosea sp. TAF32]|uniref:hypothetical protein n=1 Tax=Bosea sp. TAF32 TaxID=3237482 RepID=UPI003F9032AA